MCSHWLTVPTCVNVLSGARPQRSREFIHLYCLLNFCFFSFTGLEHVQFLCMTSLFIRIDQISAQFFRQ